MHGLSSWNARRIVAAAACAALALAGTMVLAAVPTFPELAEGDQLASSRKWDEAEKWYYDFVKKNPNHGEALRRLTLVELRRPGGDEVRARQYAERSLNIEANQPISLFLLAKAHEAAGDDGKALAIYDKLIEMGPGKDDPSRAGAVHLARFNRGLVAARSGDGDKAKEMFREVLRREPQQAYATWELGVLALANGEHAEALDWLKKTKWNVTNWAPMEAWPYPQGRYGYIRENTDYDLARALLASGETEEAKRLLKPLYERVKRSASFKRSRGGPPKAKAPLQIGQTDKRFENAPFYYAEVLAKLGETKEAKKIFKSFSRMSLGDGAMRGKAKARAKEL